MTATGRRCLAAGVLVATLGAACSSGGSSTDAARLRSSAVTSLGAARPVVTTATSSAAAPVFDAAPPPAVVDHGPDGIVIVRSLVEYGRWLELHHPDPGLVGRAYERGSRLARNITREVAQLRRAHQRIREIDTAPLDFTRLASAPNVLSFRVIEHVARRELVDVGGRVLQRAGPATEQYLISTMRFDRRDGWRLNLVDRQGPRLEVQV